MPFGYVQSEHDPKLLLPVEKELDLLQQAFHFLRTCSIRQVQQWLMQASGRKISCMGLWSIYKKLKADRNNRYYENKKKAIQRRKAEERDRELRRTIAEAKAAEKARVFAGDNSKAGAVSR